MDNDDKKFMTLAIALAAKGGGFVNPNPQVGAVIVKDDRIIGKGYHERYGQLHAERNALASCTEDPAGASMYVTLEPCCHYGKTPPCTQAIIESGITDVIIGSRDPNPKVAGKGISTLESAGMHVVRDFMKAECDEINEIFFHYITKATPFVTMKYAMTIDGKIATTTGESRWISNETSRQHTHSQRGRYMAIMVGSATVIKDDPLLTARYDFGPDPIRIVCDTGLCIPSTSKVVAPGTIIATAVMDSLKHEAYEAKGAEILVLPKDDSGHIDLKRLMTALGKRRIDSLILEGGSTLNWSALKAGIVNKVQAYVAPKIFGGHSAKGPVGGEGVTLPDNGFALGNTKITELDGDFLLESEVIMCSQE